MKIAVISCWYNEEMLAKLFLKNHAYADRIFILLDKNSSDASDKILRCNDTVRVVQSVDMHGGLDDLEKINSINVLAQSLAGEFDWIVAVDADEFVHCDIRSILEQSHFDTHNLKMWDVFRHKDEADFDSDGELSQRKHGVFHGVKPCIVRPKRDTAWSVGCHDLNNKMRVGDDIVGSHWRSADPVIALSRRLSRRSRASAANRSRNFGYHNYDVTEESILTECKVHLNDPLIGEEKTTASIRILAIGPQGLAPRLADVRSKGLPDFCEKNFHILHRTNEDELEFDLAGFKPHVILTPSDWSKYPKLAAVPLAARKKWQNILDASPDNISASATALFSSQLDRDQAGSEPVVSIFTPTFNTERTVIERAYASLLRQSYRNWEWVIYDDSTDNVVFDILVEMSKKDYRIRPYRGVHSGRIGETKRNAASLCRGDILVELDHDDELASDCVKSIVDAFAAYPDAGFAYTHCAEMIGDRSRPRYGDGWGFGYGAYREEAVNGKTCDVTLGPPINSKTIRYITACPNHARAWRAKAYWEAGGHNPILEIADDYELMVRTFLVTRMVRIDYCGYIQHYHENNSQSSRLPEIQRIVTLTSRKYNQQIHNRICSLGLNDFSCDQKGNIDFSKTTIEPHNINYEYSPLSKNPRLAIVTALTRPENIQAMLKSLGDIPVHWIVVKDMDALIEKNIPSIGSPIHKVTVLEFSNKTINHVGGFCLKNKALDFIAETSREELVYFLDDDNILYPRFVDAVLRIASEKSDPIIVFKQDLSGGKFRGIDIRTQHIDLAQYVLRSEIVKEERFPLDYTGDGIFIESLAKRHSVYRHDYPLCFFNKLSNGKIDHGSWSTGGK